MESKQEEYKLSNWYRQSLVKQVQKSPVTDKKDLAAEMFCITLLCFTLDYYELFSYPGSASIVLNLIAILFYVFSNTEKKAQSTLDTYDLEIAFRNAAEQGDLPKLKEIFAKLGKERIDAYDLTGTTALHLAARQKQVECIKFLVTQGADINKKDWEKGNTPLHEAIDFEPVKHDAKKNHDYRSLLVMVSKSHDDIFDPKSSAEYDSNYDCLIANKADQSIFDILLERKNESSSHFDRAKKCIANTVDDRFEKIAFPFRVAAKKGDLETLKKNLFQLTKAHIDAAGPNSGKTALHWAARYKRLEAIKFLIAQGADINKTDLEGNTPVHEAVNFEGIPDSHKNYKALLILVSLDHNEKFEADSFPDCDIRFDPSITNKKDQKVSDILSGVITTDRYFKRAVECIKEKEKELSRSKEKEEELNRREEEEKELSRRVKVNPLSLNT